MRFSLCVIAALCLSVLAEAADPSASNAPGSHRLAPRRGGKGGGGKGGGGKGGGGKGGGGKGGGGKGSGKPSGGKPGSGKPSGGKPGNTGGKPGNTGGKPGNTGGSTGKGTGPYGDRPPSYASLFPSRPGFKAGGRPAGAPASPQRYTPPPPYSAQASYVPIGRGQVMHPNTLAAGAPAAYYASPSRSRYPGAWGYGYYPIFPYPWWAMGGGAFVGASYHQHGVRDGAAYYESEFRNITVVNATNTPLLADMDLFGNGVNVSFVDFNNGSVAIAPCGGPGALPVPGARHGDCGEIRLDIMNGSVVAGNANAAVHDEITFFTLSLAGKSALLRTQTISNTANRTAADADSPAATVWAAHNAALGLIAAVAAACM